MRRSLAGMRMALNMPLSAFAGIAIRLTPGDDGNEPTVAVVLEHKDPGLALSLFVSTEADDAMAEWRSWAQVLGLPQIISNDEGGWRELFARVGGVLFQRAKPRRRRHSVLQTRRPSLPLRRKAGKLRTDAPVYRGEHDSIGRD